MRKTNPWDKILLFFTLIALALGCIGLTFFPAARYSEAERRYLAELPEITANGIKNGTVSAALDDYASERLPLRNIGRRLFALEQLLLGRREVRDVILCRDGSLLRRLPVNQSVFEKNLSALARLQKSLAPLSVTVAVAPRRIDVRDEVLPALYDTVRDRADWEQLPQDTVTFTDCKEDACWYRTDHHWTSEGAYFAYVRLGEQLGYTPYPKSDFTPETVSKSFYGTSYAAAGIPFVSPDKVTLLRFASDETYCVIRDGLPAPFSGFYSLEKAKTQDTYDVFLGGNCGVTEITQGENDTRPTLLVVKDSFANALLPFLALHYRILAIDPRYTSTDPCTLAQNADRVLVLCGMQTLTQTPFISLLKK